MSDQDNYLPSVFLSLSGADDDFVARVHAHLPDGLAYFYRKSFLNGENLIAAMEDRVGKSTLFVLFASKNSAQSDWVKFEIDRARTAAITNSKFRILVFPIDREVRVSDLPKWMSSYWIPSAGQSSRDIARYIRNTLIYQGIITSPTGEGYGRGGLVDVEIQDISRSIVENGTAPNVFIFAGVNGIGRRTVARQFLKRAFPAEPDLAQGPEFVLPQFADLDDVYRAIRQEIDQDFSISGFKKDLEAFRTLKVADQVVEIESSIRHFFSLGQAVTFVTSNGIFEDKGHLKPWVSILFSRMQNVHGKWIIVSNRQAHENELARHKNVIQFSVPPLADADVKSILVAMAPSMNVRPVLPSNDTIRAIGGHPAIAKLASRLLAQHGPKIIEDDPRGLFSIQDDILKESLDVNSLTDAEKEILSVLSWLPSIHGDVLSGIISSRHKLSKTEFANLLSGLILACLVAHSGEDFTISPAIRSMFRRQYGYGAPELRAALSESLKREWAKASQNDQMRASLFDGIVFMSALEGGTLPSELQSLLLPSTIQELVRETYDSGHDDPSALERVVAWGSPALTMRMDETTREEILSYVVRALIRLRDRDTEVEKIVEIFRSKGYRLYHYLQGFYLRRRGDPRQAIGHFLEARKIRKYVRAVVGELADCYKVLAMWPELRALIKEQSDFIDKNSYLLDIYAGMLLAERNWSEVEGVIRRLRAADRGDGRADTRTASLMMRRDADYAGAAKVLTDVLTKVSGGRDNIRRMRALASANAGDYSTARSDIEILKDRPGGAESAAKIEATIFLGQGDYDSAIASLNKISAQTAQDHMLEARILEAKSSDPNTPLSDRNELRRRAGELRARYGMIDEFD
jgi:hypothetical protein